MKELEIQKLLSQFSSTLGKYHVKFWPDYLSKLEEQLTRAYASGEDQEKREALTRIKGIYGGMGSFTDIFITNLAGHTIATEDESAVNEEFQHLRTQLYLLLKEELASLEEPGGS